MTANTQDSLGARPWLAENYPNPSRRNPSSITVRPSQNVAAEWSQAIAAAAGRPIQRAETGVLANAAMPKASASNERMYERGAETARALLQAAGVLRAATAVQGPAQSAHADNHAGVALLSANATASDFAAARKGADEARRLLSMIGAKHS